MISTMNNLFGGFTAGKVVAAYFFCFIFVAAARLWFSLYLQVVGSINSVSGRLYCCNFFPSIRHHQLEPNRYFVFKEGLVLDGFYGFLSATCTKAEEMK